ncbi:MAG: ATP-binding cassette domain-containing protein [Halobacteriales archaeon]|nr:ATP-binding cassette domain-containing protein [Halobacteriales archaeon]
MPLRLEVQRVDKRFAARAALRDASLEARGGEVLVLLGPSGSGKSTLLRCIAGLERPDEGHIRLDGAPPRHDDPRVGLVRQRPALFRRTAAENVLFGLEARERPRDEAHSAARAAMERLGIWELRDAPARKLSAGEQQRVAFARALVLAPELLLLDEATAHLDPANALLLEREVRRQAHFGCCVVAATHDLPAALRLADRVLVLAEGRVCEEGPARSFFAKPASPEGQALLRAGMAGAENL